VHERVLPGTDVQQLTIPTYLIKLLLPFHEAILSYQSLTQVINPSLHMSLFQALMQLTIKTINQPYIIEISTVENCSNYNKAIKQTLKYLH
jgi:hypothetical protein